MTKKLATPAVKKAKKKIAAAAALATREEWLVTAADHLRDGLFARNGLTVPPVKVSCSWPGGGSARKRIGECWPTTFSAAKINEVFISPALGDAVKALDVLVHELVHAVDDCASGHKAAFVAAARAVGLEGKPTATHAGPTLLVALQGLAAILGPYPHSTLNLANRKKQTTRMIKVSCDDCGGVYRTTRQWIDQADELTCPFCQGDHVKVEEK